MTTGTNEITTDVASTALSPGGRHHLGTKGRNHLGNEGRLHRNRHNPIEKAFARLKAVLRKAGERTVSGLCSLIGRLVDLFQPQECTNYFSSCGYDAD